MNRLQHLSEFDPLANVQRQATLPPEPSCATLSDVLKLVEPRLGAAVLDGAGRNALHSVAKHIPAVLSTFWGLEIRLGIPEPRADILWEVRQVSADVLKQAGRNSQDPAAGTAHALRERSVFWREFGRFVEEWLDNPHWLGRLGNVWLEADTASAAGAALEACLDRPNLFWGPNYRVPGSDRDLLNSLELLGRRFYGLELDRARIEAVAATVPSEGLVFQMGVMGARSKPVMRLCVKIPDSGARIRWLADIGWPGDLSGLQATLAGLESCSGEIALDVDVLPDRVGEKLGIEVYSAERTLSMDTWQPLHDELLKQGLARADKLAALRDFPHFQAFRQLGAWAPQPTRRIPGAGHQPSSPEAGFRGGRGD